jgi:hypothetical protein
VPDGLYEGKWLTEESRLLARDETGDAIYATPTDRSRVCYTIAVPASSSRSSNGGGGCIKDFNSATPIGFSVYDPDEVDSGHPVIVGGIAPNGVVRIDVRVSGSSHDVTLVQNAFVYELASAASYPNSLEVVYADGSRREITIPDPREAMLAGLSG